MAGAGSCSIRFYVGSLHWGDLCVARVLAVLSTLVQGHVSSEANSSAQRDHFWSQGPQGQVADGPVEETEALQLLLSMSKSEHESSTTWRRTLSSTSADAAAGKTADKHNTHVHNVSTEMSRPVPLPSARLVAASNAVPLIAYSKLAVSTEQRNLCV